MAIPESFLDELNSRVNIVDVVSAYLPLNKKGANYWGLCPFHHEKTPSFSVNESKQIFHCFGCGKGGGPVRFVMEMDSLPFPEAVRKLAPGLKLAAESAEDGVIEAYEHESLPLFGVQWHPERLTNTMRDQRTPDMAPLFTYFLELVQAHCGK